MSHRRTLLRATLELGVIVALCVLLTTGLKAGLSRYAVQQEAAPQHSIAGGLLGRKIEFPRKDFFGRGIAETGKRLVVSVAGCMSCSSRQAIIPRHGFDPARAILIAPDEKVLSDVTKHKELPNYRMLVAAHVTAPSELAFGLVPAVVIDNDGVIVEVADAQEGIESFVRRVRR